jgi:hypothetical protein
MTTALLLSEIDASVLQGLARFRFLTVEQMLAVGLAKDVKHLRTRLARLEKARFLVKTQKSFDTLNGGGLPSLYWLADKGAAFLQDEFGLPATAPNTSPQLGRDIPHRIGTVAVNIAFQKWAEGAGVGVGPVLAYYERGAKLDAAKRPMAQATTVEWGAGPAWAAGSTTPDIITSATLVDGKARLLVIEYERGGVGGTPYPFLKKLGTFRAAIDAGAIETHFGATSAARFLVVFSTPEMLAAAARGWPKAQDAIWDRFFLKTLDEVGDFAKGWRSVTGTRKGLFG